MSRNYRTEKHFVQPHAAQSSPAALVDDFAELVRLETTDFLPRPLLGAVVADATLATCIDVGRVNRLAELEAHALADVSLIAVVLVMVMLSVSPVLAIVGPEQLKQFRLKCTTPWFTVGVS